MKYPSTCPKLLLLFTTLTMASNPLPAQKLSLGFIGGLNLNDDFRGRPTYFGPLPDGSNLTVRYSSTAYRPLLGGKAELRLALGWSIEANLLYHRATYTTRYSFDPPTTLFGRTPLARDVSRNDENLVELPILAKYQFAVGPAHVLLEAGPSFRPFLGPNGPGSIGFTTGVGASFSAGPIRLQPVIRYTRWQDSDRYRSPLRRDVVSLVVGADLASPRRTGLGHANLAVGFIGGSTITSDFPGKVQDIGFPDAPRSSGVTSRLAGFAADINVVDHWAVEVDAIYHPLSLSERARATVITWEFPVLAKYTFRTGAVRPFFAAGPSFRASGNTNSTHPSTFGATASTGVDFHLGRFTIAPTLRYTRWKANSTRLFSPAYTIQNQVQALVSITFGKH